MHNKILLGSFIITFSIFFLLLDWNRTVVSGFDVLCLMLLMCNAAFVKHHPWQNCHQLLYKCSYDLCLLMDDHLFCKHFKACISAAFLHWMDVTITVIHFKNFTSNNVSAAVRSESEFHWLVNVSVKFDLLRILYPEAIITVQRVFICHFIPAILHWCSHRSRDCLLPVRIYLWKKSELMEWFINKVLLI